MDQSANAHMNSVVGNPETALSGDSGGSQRVPKDLISNLSVVNLQHLHGPRMFY